MDAEDVIDGPGRPKKRYGLTSAGREAFPRDYALLLDLVLGKMRETQGREALEALLGGIAADLAPQGARKASLETRLAGLVALYGKLGFDASLERTKDGFTLVQRNCIFLRAATAGPRLLCQCLDEGIMRAALPEAHVQLEASLATGAPAAATSSRARA